MKIITNSDAPAYISERLRFQNTTGSLYARTATDIVDGYLTGSLPPDECDRLRQAIAERPTYIVYSYNTPIGWLESDGWHIPDVRYSVTTSRHQSKLRQGANV